MKLNIIAITAALVAGCGLHDEGGLLVATKLIQSNPSAGGTSGATTCVYDPTTSENVFGVFDPAVGYQHAVVVENRLASNGTGPGRINTNDFQVLGVTVKTEVLVGPAQNIPDRNIGANGLVTVGSSLPVAVQLAQAGAIQVGSDVRFHIQVFGRLLDGSSVKTNSYDYTASARTIPATPLCPAGQTATTCEGSATTLSQDTGFACK